MYFTYTDGSRFKIKIPGDGTLSFDGTFEGQPSREIVTLSYAQRVAPGIYVVVWHEYISPSVVTQVHNFVDMTVTSSIVSLELGTVTVLEGRISFDE